MSTALKRKWMYRYNQLKRYYEKNGHSNISARHKRNKSLGTWVVRQRVIKNSLTPEQLDLLDSIQFVWDPRKNSWEDNYEKLITYKDQHGDTNVPVNFEKDPIFGRWVQKQRRIKLTLSEDKIEKLNDLGFIWNGNDYIWEQNFDTLQSFIHKNRRLPSYKENLKLYNWINQQKIKFKNLRLEEGKVEKLRGIGIEIN